MAEVKEGYSLTHAFRFFKKKHKHRGGIYSSMSRKTYRDICKDFNKMLSEEVLTSATGTRLPFGLGVLRIKKFEINWDNPPIDFNASKKAGKRIYHLNTHSDGYCGRWHWQKRNSLITNLIYYSFLPVKGNSREVPKIFKKPGGHAAFLM